MCCAQARHLATFALFLFSCIRHSWLENIYPHAPPNTSSSISRCVLETESAELAQRLIDFFIEIQKISTPLKLVERSAPWNSSALKFPDAHASAREDASDESESSSDAHSPAVTTWIANSRAAALSAIRLQTDLSTTLRHRSSAAPLRVH